MINMKQITKKIVVIVVIASISVGVIIPVIILPSSQKINEKTYSTNEMTWIFNTAFSKIANGFRASKSPYMGGIIGQSFSKEILTWYSSTSVDPTPSIDALLKNSTGISFTPGSLFFFEKTSMLCFPNNWNDSFANWGNSNTVPVISPMAFYWRNLTTSDKCVFFFNATYLKIDELIGKSGITIHILRST